MDEAEASSSSSAEKKDKFYEFLNFAKCWTLKQDKELKDALQSTVSGMLDAIQHFENVGNALESEVELFECQFENIQNRIGCLKMERLVKEQVDEIPVDLLRGRSKKMCKENLVGTINQEEYEQQTISTISNAVRRAFEIFDVQQDKSFGSLGVDILNSGDPSDPSTSMDFELSKEKVEESANAWEGMNILRSFERSELPPIIGTAEFYEAMKRTSEPKEDSPTANERGAAKTPLPAPTTAATKIEEEDIASVSSGLSAPPQDPVVVQQSPSMPAGGRGDMLTMRSALMEEITGRARKREEKSEKTEKIDGEKCEIDRQTMRGEEKRKIEERQWAKSDEKEVQTNGRIGQQGNERVADTQRQLVAERVEINGETGKRYRGREVREHGQVQREKRRGNDERRVRRSLFSSSSEGEEDSSTSVKSVLPPLEERTQTLANGPGPNLGRSLSQRPVSVQSFGSCAEDGALATAADHSTAIDRQPPALVRKTESAKTVSVVSNNEEFGPTSVKNRIAQIGARIPVGKRTADGARREDEGQRTEQRNTTAVTDTKAATALPTEAIKTRAKAPSARRAPSQRIVGGKPPLPSASSPLEAVKDAPRQQNEGDKRPASRGAMDGSAEDKKILLTGEQTSENGGLFGDKPPLSKVVGSAGPPRMTPAHTVPPPVKPKTKARPSIFSSSSSDDDLGFSKVIGTTAKMNAPPPQHSQKANEPSKAKPSTHSEQQQKPPPFSYKKAAAPSKTRKKGIFDDSDSDF